LQVNKFRKLPAFNNHLELKQKILFSSYREVDECLLRCESKSKQVADLKTAYAGLQFVCKQRKEGKKNKI